MVTNHIVLQIGSALLQIFHNQTSDTTYYSLSLEHILKLFSVKYISQFVGELHQI